MSEIFVLHEWYNDGGDSVVGLFTTLELAKSAADTHYQTYRKTFSKTDILSDWYLNEKGEWRKVWNDQHPRYGHGYRIGQMELDVITDKKRY